MELGLVGGLVAGLVGLAIWQFIERSRWRRRFAGIVDVEREIAERREAAAVEIESAKKVATHDVAQTMREAAELREQHAAAEARYEQLRTALAAFEVIAEDASFGLYVPTFQLATSNAYKQRLTEAREAQQRMIRDGTAVRCGAVWAVGDCRSEGERMQKQYSKLLVRAFNAECDTALAKLAWNNVTRMLERINQSFESINKLAAALDIELAAAYRNLKLDEVRLEYELQRKRREDQEAQRELREQLRDEDLAHAEAAAACKQAETDELAALAQLAAAHAELAAGDSAELQAKVAACETAVAEAREARQRAIARAQHSGAGHVYILSNVGSFGDKVVTIGMTRRANPLDRIRELEAAVPFPFDVHAMIPTDDAPALEARLHRQFADRRVNLVHDHGDCFQVTLEEIEAFARGEGIALSLTRTVEAQQFRETLELRRRATQPRRPPARSAERQVLND